MARFHYPSKITAEEKAGGESDQFGPLPKASNVELCHEFFEKLEVCEAKYIDREKAYCLFLIPPSLPTSQPWDSGSPLHQIAKY
jgi:hypothetical protein